MCGKCGGYAKAIVLWSSINRLVQQKTHQSTTWTRSNTTLTSYFFPQVLLKSTDFFLGHVVLYRVSLVSFRFIGFMKIHFIFFLNLLQVRKPSFLLDWWCGEMTRRFTIVDERKEIDLIREILSHQLHFRLDSIGIVIFISLLYQSWPNVNDRHCFPHFHILITRRYQ